MPIIFSYARRVTAPKPIPNYRFTGFSLFDYGAAAHRYVRASVIKNNVVLIMDLATVYPNQPAYIANAALSTNHGKPYMPDGANVLWGDTSATWVNIGDLPLASGNDNGGLHPKGYGWSWNYDTTNTYGFQMFTPTGESGSISAAKGIFW
jgi:hypothetical protein